MKVGQSMKPESSKNSKTDVSDKFVARRKIMFPRDLFIELRLSKKQIEKVRGWERAGHTFLPMWFANCERVLFIDEEAFNEWTTKSKTD